MRSDRQRYCGFILSQQGDFPAEILQSNAMLLIKSHSGGANLF